MGLPRFAVVDLETSGLRPGRDAVLQVGLVVVEGGGSQERWSTVERWSTLVRLPWPWSRVGPTHIHGLTRRSLRQATPAREALAELARRVDGAVFTGHNARFDAAFLRRSAARHGVTLPLGPGLCTLDLSRRLDPDRALTHGLADVCERFDVPLDGHHDALADAAATAAVLPHLLAAHHVREADDLGPLYVSLAGSRRDPVPVWSLRRRWRRLHTATATSSAVGQVARERPASPAS
jgi:DNA polymerase-3 subunit epsilon